MSAPGSPAAERTPWLAYGCLAGSMALVGSYVGLSRTLVAALPIFLLAWLRFGIAAVAMVGWVRRQPGEPALSPHDRKLLFWESFLGNFLFSICMLFGVAATSAVAAGVVMAAIPAAVALMSWAFMGERIGLRVGGGIACAVAGIGWLALERSGTHGAAAGTAPGQEPLWGYALLLGAVLCEAAYVVIGKRLTAQVSPRRISSLINLWGLALVTPLGAWQAWHFDFSQVQVGTWLLLLFYALAASVVTVWLWMQGLRSVPAPRAGVFSVMLPVAATAVGVVFLGESLGAAQLGALSLALVGLLLATWPTGGARDQRRDRGR
ncbi:DMT family transporter [Ideonella sp.]|uniref:DMT family transporter n=1 Tax=Ideonella sp. TaxID=1929293 RepID=UPI0035AF4D9B